VNLDLSFHLSGFTSGVTYALVNNRDKAAANFRSQAIDRGNTSLLDHLDSLMRTYSFTVIMPIKDAHKRDSLLNMMTNGSSVLRAKSSIDSFPSGFIPIVKQYKLAELNKQIQTEYDSLMDDIGQKGLLTIAVYGATNSFNKLNFGYAEMAYLKGKNVQADVRSRLSYQDTVIANTNYRFGCDVTGGADIELLHSAKDAYKSLLEIKPNLEYQKIFKGAYPGEKDELFTVNVDIRLRITDNLWIPIIIKYDLQDHNFLSFLNVSFNMDAFKKSLKGISKTQ